MFVNMDFKPFFLSNIIPFSQISVKDFRNLFRMNVQKYISLQHFFLLIGERTPRLQNTVQGAAGQGGVIQHFLRFSKSNTFLPIRYIFRSSVFKNRQLRPLELASHPRENFHLNFLLLLFLGYQSTFADVLRQVNKQHQNWEICELGSYNNLAQHGKCKKKKIHSTLLHGGTRTALCSGNQLISHN